MINIPLHQQRWESDCSTRWSNLIELSPVLFSWRLNFFEIALRRINLKTTLKVEKTEVKPGSCRESRKTWLWAVRCEVPPWRPRRTPAWGGRNFFNVTLLMHEGKKRKRYSDCRAIQAGMISRLGSSLSLGLNIRCSPRAYMLRAGPQSGAIWS